MFHDIIIILDIPSKAASTQACLPVRVEIISTNARMLF